MTSGAVTSGAGPSGKGTAPLEGVRVVEVAGWMAAPGAAAVLADLGADVVKVEPLRGDPVRGVIRQPEVDAPFDAPFHMDNRGKRGIAVALSMAGGYGRDIDVTVGVHLQTLQLAHDAWQRWPSSQQAALA